ncbi:19615_t:CDS:2, partial [Gigaspora margarita]
KVIFIVDLFTDKLLMTMKTDYLKTVDNKSIFALVKPYSRLQLSLNGPCSHDRRHCDALTVLGANLDLLSVIIFPAPEKACSEATEDAGIT